MVNTTLKEVTNAVVGQDGDHAGGTDWNQMAQVLKGSHATERIQSPSVQKATWVTKSAASQTLLNTEEFVLADASSNAVIITLPTAAGNLNGHFYIKRVDSALTNLVTVTTTSSQTIDGKASVTLNDRDAVLDLYSDGANWRVADLRLDLSYANYRAKGATLNRWYSNELLQNTAAIAAVVVAGTMYAMPFIVTKTTTIDSVAINVTTGGAGSSANVGIYADNGNMYPGALIQDFGSKATTATGVVTFTTGLPLSLLPGLYWLAFLCSATAPAVSGWAVAQCPPMLGSTSVLTVAYGVGWSVAQAAGALPSPFTAGGAVIIAAPIPAVFWRTSG